MNEAQELFGRVMDVPEGERLDWLRRHCAGDVALRAAVERLLGADARASLLDENPAAVADSLLRSGGDHATPGKVGR